MGLFSGHNDKDLTFEAVLKQYERPVYWYIRRLVVSHDDAQDVMQETFIRVFQGLGSLKEKGALKVWIYRIATNECMRHLKRSREQSIDDIDEEQMLLNRLVAGDYVNLEDEAAVALQRAVLTLSEQERTVFNLRYYDDMSYEEISNVTGSSVATLKVAYHHAKEKIKNELQK